MLINQAVAMLVTQLLERILTGHFDTHGLSLGDTEIPGVVLYFAAHWIILDLERLHNGGDIVAPISIGHAWILLWVWALPNPDHWIKVPFVV